jgi:putative intracellular protease/amidase
MAKLLMVVSSARTIRLADASEHPVGYRVKEVQEPYETFVGAGVDVVIATPDGKVPQPDPWGLEPFFHYPQVDEDFMFSVLRRFAYHSDRVRVTFTHFAELNLVAVRRVYLALRDTGVESAEARRVVESAAHRAWRHNTDFIEVLAEDGEVAARLPEERMEEIRDEVWRASQAKARSAAETLAKLPGLQQPAGLTALADEEIEGFGGLFIPGGHGAMVDFADNADIGRAVRLMHEAGKPIATLCHGPAALLAAPDVDGAWMFDGYRMTAFTDEEEDQTKAGKIGMPWYLEAALKNRGAVFDDGDAAWVSHVVVDRNLITAQNPGSSEASAGALLKRLGGVNR